MSDNIMPAINLRDDGPHEMSPEEFQRKLYTWFEDRGLLAELRTHLRAKMIDVLKETAIGRPFAGQKQQQQTASPKRQAINMVVAEFLLRQQCHYTLSVFTSEVPLINVLPQMSNGVSNNTKANRTSDSDATAWRFVAKDFWDVMETLGFQKTSEEGQRIHELYYETNSDDSLLLCVLRTLRTERHEPFVSTAYVTEQWIKDMYDALVRAKVYEPQLTDAFEALQRIVRLECDRIKQQEKDNYVSIRNRLREDNNGIEIECRKRMCDMERSFRAERDKMIVECKSKHDCIDALGTTIRSHQRELNVHVANIQKRERKLIARERSFERRNAKLIERLNVAKRRSADAAIDSSPTNRDDKKASPTKSTTNDSMRRQQIEKDNAALRDRNVAQDVRIRELSARVLSLTDELKRARNAMTPLVERTPPPSNEDGPPNVRSNRNGAGENAASRRSSSSDEPSPTDDVLQETRERLRSLERESDEVDRKYREFRAMHRLRLDTATSRLLRRATIDASSAASCLRFVPTMARGGGTEANEHRQRVNAEGPHASDRTRTTEPLTKTSDHRRTGVSDVGCNRRRTYSSGTLGRESFVDALAGISLSSIELSADTTDGEELHVM